MRGVQCGPVGLDLGLSEEQVRPAQLALFHQLAHLLDHFLIELDVGLHQADLFLAIDHGLEGAGHADGKGDLLEGNLPVGA